MTTEEQLEKKFLARLEEAEKDERIRKAKLIRFLQMKGVEEEEAMRKRGLCPYCRTFLPMSGICNCQQGDKINKGRYL